MVENNALQTDSAEVWEEKNAGIIKALLCVSPPATSRETKSFLHQLRTLDIPDIYNRILRLNKLSNKELLHFITIMNTHSFYRGEPADGAVSVYGGLDLEALINLKFPAQDKYLSQITIEYFGIVKKVFMRLTERQRLEIFARYLYLFTNNICNDIALYRNFTFILRNGFLDTFISQKLYLGFPFLKEFLIDFYEIGSSLVKIGYEVPHLRELVLNLALDTSVKRAIWLAQNWRVPGPFTVSDTFFLFDCTYFIDDRAKKRMALEADLLECLSDDLRIHGYTLVPENIDLEEMDGAIFPATTPRPACSNKKHIATDGPSHDISAWASRAISLKKAFQRSIQAFNESSKMENLSVRQARISPKVDLKVLGEFLCKPKNSNLFEEFADSFEFRELDILESLRTFLSSFYMIGESQIIERVIRVFVTSYLKQNEPDQPPDATLFDKYKSLAYSFVVLNTMLHNPSVEKRPPFDEYSRLVGFSEDFVVDGEILRLYYTSIKEQEIKLPQSWEDSYDKYALALELLDEPYTASDSIDDAVLTPPCFVSSQGNTMNSGQSESITHPHGLCADCILYAYRLLFSDSYRVFFSMSPLSFQRISRFLGNEKAFGEYISGNKHNIGRALEAFKLYISRHVLSQELSLDFLDLLGHTLKPKASVFSDFKSLFSASKQDLHGEKPLANLPAHVSHAYESVLRDILKIEFNRKDICNTNLKMLYTVSVQNKKADGALLLRALATALLFSNVNLLNDISYLDGPLLSNVVQRNPSLMELFSEDQKLSSLLSKSDLDSNDWCILMGTSNYGPSAFEIFCRGQGRLGRIEEAFQVFPKDHAVPPHLPAGVETRLFGDFLIAERYAGPLKDPANAVKLFSSSNSVLNLKIARDINKDGCPLNNPVFTNFDTIVYMLEKSSNEFGVIHAYALKVLGYYSSNLILTTRLLSHVYSLLPLLDPSFRTLMLQMFLKRHGSVSSGSSPCCALHLNADVSEAERLVKSLIADSLIKKEDVVIGTSEPETAVVEL